MCIRENILIESDEREFTFTLYYITPGVSHLTRRELG